MGFSAIGGREAKAEKIVAILAAAGRSLKPADRLLDLGCGSGEIAGYLAEHCQVTCADRVDQRIAGTQLPFQRSESPLPFTDGSFDVVISNHVIEHTQDPHDHLSEIRRVLRAGGVAYLATPNRLWPWEVHARLPLLHYLPWRLFSRIGVSLGRLHEPIRLHSLQGLRVLSDSGFQVEPWHQRILRHPERFSLRFPAWLRGVLGALPGSLLERTAALQPTLILLLTRR